ncbi:MAG TPA: hypothetical protein VMB02_00860 [Candidatus Aquilonibacter sp.]|nr:hypothetical protein [Candidatus Aquilonibacter sp.]
MRRLAIAILLCTLSAAAQRGPLQPAPQQPTTATNNSSQPTVLVVPAGRTVPLEITQPVFAKSAAVGEAIFAETVFPVTVNGRMAIPAGTYVQGQIDSLSRPGIFSPHAQFQIHFTRLVFANGYTFDFSAIQNLTSVQAPGPNPAVPDASPATDVIPAVANVYVAVTLRNDVLLDNGTQFDMILQEPVQLISASVAAAVRVSKPPLIGHFETASTCRAIPATQGTPDTVIPGTPGTSGTPDIVIPGANGAPDTVIPGTPATPGTPDTVIPGTPGTPGIPCPGPPVVTESTKTQKQAFSVSAPVQLDGQQLAAGDYEATWKGPGPRVSVKIAEKKKTVATVQARLVLLNRKSPSVALGTQPNPDGSLSLQSLRFKGQSFALYFDPAGTGETL